MTKAMDLAVRLLTRREHGARELARKMAQRGVSEAEIEATLRECQRLHLQDDERFAQMLCRTRFSQGYGPLRIRECLSKVHIDRELIASVLSSYTEDEWFHSAQQVIRKKYPESLDYSYHVRQKQKQFLVYRGFSPEMISRLARTMVST